MDHGRLRWAIWEKQSNWPLRRAGEAQDAFERFLVEEEEPFDDTYNINLEGGSWFRPKIKIFRCCWEQKKKSFKFSDLVVQPDGEPFKPAGVMEQVIYCILEINWDWRYNYVKIFILPAVAVQWVACHILQICWDQKYVQPMISWYNNTHRTIWNESI